MADNRSELRILHSRSSLGRYLSDDRITDDAQNLRYVWTVLIGYNSMKKALVKN